MRSRREFLDQNPNGKKNDREKIRTTNKKSKRKAKDRKQKKRVRPDGRQTNTKMKKSWGKTTKSLWNMKGVEKFLENYI